MRGLRDAVEDPDDQADKRFFRAGAEGRPPLPAAVQRQGDHPHSRYGHRHERTSNAEQSLRARPRRTSRGKDGGRCSHSRFPGREKQLTAARRPGSDPPYTPGRLFRALRGPYEIPDQHRVPSSGSSAIDKTADTPVSAGIHPGVSRLGVVNYRRVYGLAQAPIPRGQRLPRVDRCCLRPADSAVARHQSTATLDLC